MTDSVAAAERQTIRDAMERLIKGVPIRSDGKLTIKSLAEEAGVKRWLLTHRHTDLQDEFRDRIAGVNRVPKPVQDLLDIKDDLQSRADRLAVELQMARSDLETYARIINVLTIENAEKDKRLAELAGLLAGVSQRGEAN
jgi:hypothetical protein